MATNKGQDLTGHFRLVYPTEYICAADLQGRDVTVKIARVTRETLTMAGGKKDQKAVLHMTTLRGRPLGKRWVAGKTVLKQIAAALDEPDVSRWIGGTVTIYPTTCKGARGEQMDCIRVRTRTDTRAADIPEEMAIEPAPRVNFDDDEPEGEPPPIPLAQDLANRAAQAKDETAIRIVENDLDAAAKARPPVLKQKEYEQLRALIAARKEALAGVVNPDAEPPPAGAS